MSNEKNLRWLFDIGDEILPRYMGIISINHEIRPPIKQPSNVQNHSECIHRSESVDGDP